MSLIDFIILLCNNNYYLKTITILRGDYLQCVIAGMDLKN